MRSTLPKTQLPDHPGLAYTRYAPAKGEGAPSTAWTRWLDGLDSLRISPDYQTAFERWKKSFPPGTMLLEVELASRLLVGHGEESGTEVGLTLHHAWGVPVVPGSALKGLTAHYTEIAYGPDKPGDSSDPERIRFQGPVWDDRRIRQGPGDVYATIFGSPDADDGLTQASQGHVHFHDAWYVPNANQTNPFVRDVLTVHQKTYYDHRGQDLPNDYDSPNPVSFLTVRPGTRFLVALTGPEAWCELAKRLLIEAWSDWGLGGKTSAGYGRIKAGNVRSDTVKPDSPLLDDLRAHLDSKEPLPGQTDAPSNRQKLEALQSEDWQQKFAAADSVIRKEAAAILQKKIKRGNDAVIALRDAICAVLEG